MPRFERLHGLATALLLGVAQAGCGDLPTEPFSSDVPETPEPEVWMTISVIEEEPEYECEMQEYYPWWDCSEDPYGDGGWVGGDGGGGGGGSGGSTDGAVDGSDEELLTTSFEELCRRSWPELGWNCTSRAPTFSERNVLAEILDTLEPACPDVVADLRTRTFKMWDLRVEGFQGPVYGHTEDGYIHLWSGEGAQADDKVNWPRTMVHELGHLRGLKHGSQIDLLVQSCGLDPLA